MRYTNRRILYFTYLQWGENHQHESAASRGAAAQDGAEDRRRHKEEDGSHPRTSHQGAQ